MFNTIWMTTFLIGFNLLGSGGEQFKNPDHDDKQTALREKFGTASKSVIHSWIVGSTLYSIRHCQPPHERHLDVEAFDRQQQVKTATLSKPVYGDDSDDMIAPSIRAILASAKPAHEYCFVALSTQSDHPSEEKIIGVVAGGIKAKDALSYGRAGWWQPGSGYVSDIAVLPEYQARHGVGTQLMTTILNAFTSVAPRVFLENKGGNRAAGLYRKMGFRQAYHDGGELWLKDLDTNSPTERLKNAFMQAEEKLHNETNWSLREKQEPLREKAEHIIEKASTASYPELPPYLAEEIRDFLFKANFTSMESPNQKTDHDIDAEQLANLKIRFNEAVRQLQTRGYLELLAEAHTISQYARSYLPSELGDRLRKFLEKLEIME